MPEQSSPLSRRLAGRRDRGHGAMRGIAVAGLASLAALALAAPAGGQALPSARHDAAQPAAPSPLPPVASLLQAPANAIYTGVGANGKGTFSLQTDGAGAIVFYDAAWRRTVCGIPSFELYYDAGSSPGIVVDAAGTFVEEYSLTYRSRGKRYTVRAIDSGQIGEVTGDDGVTRDLAVMRERVWIKRQKRGATWCSGIHKKLFVAERVSGGA